MFNLLFMETTLEKSLSEDQKILDLMKEDDQKAFELLYKKYWRSLVNFASYYLDDVDSCEEITQQLFVQVYKKRFELNIRSSISSYLHAALRNRILNFLRDQALYKKHMSVASNKVSYVQNNVEQFMDLRQLQGKISLSLGNMPSKYREVYVLHQDHDYTIKKISELLKRPADTVEKQLKKATCKLRNSLMVQQ